MAIVRSVLRPVVRSAVNPVDNRLGGSWSSYWKTQADLCEGDNIDITKWIVTNPNTDVATFEQDEALIMNTLFATNADMFANNIKSVYTQSDGAWRFSLADYYTLGTPADTRAMGLTDSTNQNRVEFIRLLAGGGGTNQRLRLNIVTGGVSQYNYLTSFANFAEFKIVITATHDIKVYAWTNDAWVQQGVTKNYDLGVLAMFMATGGTDGVKTAISDVYMVSADFSTLIPTEK